MRRKYIPALGAVGLSAALVAATGCQAAEDDTAGSSDCGGKIAMFGAYSGPNSGLALPALKSAQLAVKQHNEANPGCDVTLQEFDAKGDPTEATPVANWVAGDDGGLRGGRDGGRLVADLRANTLGSDPTARVTVTVTYGGGGDRVLAPDRARSRKGVRWA